MIIDTKNLPAKLCSTDEAAKIIGCHRSRVRQYAADGTLKPYRFSQRSIMLDLAQVKRVASELNDVGRPRGGTTLD